MSPFRHILSFEAYAAIRHPSPYLVDVARDGARLVLLGGHHSTDPGDRVFAEAFKVWKQ